MHATLFLDLASSLALAGFGHALACLMQTVLHRWLGHTSAGGRLYRIHVGSHHSIYTEGHMAAPHYADWEVSLTPFFIVPVLVLCTALAWLLPLPLAACAALGLVASCVAQVTLHAQFHRTDSWLRGHRWFRRLRRLHAIHHRDGSKNFGLIDFAWDRIGGTFYDPGRSHR